jgi:hypothetical protein
VILDGAAEGLMSVVGCLEGRELGVESEGSWLVVGRD